MVFPWENQVKKCQVLKVFDLSDSNEFEFDAETFSKISLQCGNERVRLRGQPEQMRRWCLGQNKEPVQKWLDSWVGCCGQLNTSYIYIYLYNYIIYNIYIYNTIEYITDRLVVFLFTFTHYVHMIYILDIITLDIH